MSRLIEAACAGDIGKVRKNNEDNFYFNTKFLPQQNDGHTEPIVFLGKSDGIYLTVFDGMGGGDYGEVASFSASRELLKIRKLPCILGEVEEHLGFITDKVNSAVFGAASEYESRNMGSTLAGIYFYNDRIYSFNVGDSRVYGLRDNRFRQISHDHTDEEYMRKKGITGRKPRLTQYLGMNPEECRMEPYVAKAKMKTDDVYLICSDGLTDMLGDDEIKEILLSNESTGVCADELVKAALKNGGKDNITVIVCRIKESLDNWSVEDDR